MKNLFSEQNLSMLLGVLVVILVGNLVYNYFRSVNKNGQTSSDKTTQTVSETVPGSTYTIQSGDTLWSIAVKTYNNGYDWKEVYTQNADVLGKNPDEIVEGTQINLPVIAGEPIAPSAPTAYTVVAGDGLWNIAVKICNNGYAWPKIATDNKIANPNVIEVGQQLTISCN